IRNRCEETRVLGQLVEDFADGGAEREIASPVIALERAFVIGTGRMKEMLEEEQPAIHAMGTFPKGDLGLLHGAPICGCDPRVRRRRAAGREPSCLMLGRIIDGLMLRRFSCTLRRSKHCEAKTLLG